MLVGHCRMTIAKELGIKPVVVSLRLGNSDTADAYRFKLAIAWPRSKTDLKIEKIFSGAE